MSLAVLMICCLLAVGGKLVLPPPPVFRDGEGPALRRVEPERRPDGRPLEPERRPDGRPVPAPRPRKGSSVDTGYGQSRISRSSRTSTVCAKRCVCAILVFEASERELGLIQRE